MYRNKAKKITDWLIDHDLAFIETRGQIEIPCGRYAHDENGNENGKRLDHVVVHCYDNTFTMTSNLWNGAANHKSQASVIRHLDELQL
jgi:hypothetical protein